MIFYIITIILALAGFIVTAFIRHHKKIGRPLYCPLKSDCNFVVYSTHSTFLGMDVTNFGLAYYGITATLFTFLAIFPSQMPGYLFMIGFLLALFAVIFSAYLIMIQFLAIRQWCFWCLLSAVISVALLISAATALHANLYQVLIEYRTILATMHILAAALGVGVVLVTDLFFISFLRDSKISLGEADVLEILQQAVWAILGVLIVTGVALSIPVSADYLVQTKFIAKVIIIGVIVVNGAVLNLRIAPKLVKASLAGDSTETAHSLTHLRQMAFAFCTVSIVSWICAFVLVSVRQLPLSVGQILGIYAALIFLKVIGSQILAHRTIRA